jgi:uncharacterized protein (DUF2062 family)
MAVKKKSLRIAIKNYWDNFYFKLKRHFVEVLRTKTSDRSVALGYALGTFIAILPTPGFNIFLGLIFVAIFKRINKLSVVVAMAIWNTATLIPIYWLSLEIGNMIFGDLPKVEFEIELLDQVFQYTLRFFVGNVIFSIPFSVFNYYFAFWFIRRVRSNRLKRFDSKKKNL